PPQPAAAGQSRRKTASEAYFKSQVADGSILLNFRANSIVQSPGQSLVLAAGGRYVVATLHFRTSRI
ncbi:MAG: hypothetical protein WA858_09970, partial [Xanthobacteraceae bacterium]